MYKIQLEERKVKSIEQQRGLNPMMEFVRKEILKCKQQLGQFYSMCSEERRDNSNGK